MATVDASGTVPNSPVTGVIKRLFFERLDASREFQKAQAIAPFYSTNGLLSGELPIDNAGITLDLTRTPNPTTSVAWDAEDYPERELSFGSLSFAIERRLIPATKIPNAKAKHLAAASGIGIESYVANRMLREFVAAHASEVYTELGTEANYDAATYDDTTIDATTAATDFTEPLLDARQAMGNRERWSEGTPLVVVYGEDVARELVATNTNLKTFVRNSGAALPNDDALSAYTRHILGESTQVIVARARYTGSGGNTAMFAGKIFVGVAQGGPDVSFLKTLIPGANASSLLRVWTKYVEEFDGSKTAGDTAYQVKPCVSDAGFLYADITTS